MASHQHRAPYVEVLQHALEDTHVVAVRQVPAATQLDHAGVGPGLVVVRLRQGAGDAVGPRGVYILGLFRNLAEVEAVAKKIEAYR